jgi:hypothetical protein
MNTRKFEYLETIRETIEQGDIEELKDYIDEIRERVKHDQDFEEIFLEINSGRYQDVIKLIDDIIYKEMQEDFDSFGGNGENEEDEILTDSDLEKLSQDLDFDDDIKEEISFEPFDEEGYFDKTEDDNY